MKFRGKMNDVSCIRQFSQLVSLVARLAKLATMRITSSKLFIVVSDSGGLSGGSSPGLWAEIEQGHIFNEFDMEGVCEENNEIYFELAPDKLSKTLNSLKSSQSTRSLKIKLTKKHSPCLTFEVELPSQSARSRLVVHDVPVTLIPRKLWHLYQEPQMPPFQVSLYLPPLRQLRNVIDRMKNLAPYVSLAANRKGTLIVSVSTDTVDVSTYFKRLQMPDWDGKEDNAVDLAKIYTAVVDIKKLALFLLGDQVNPTRVICNIVDGKIIHLFLLHDDVTLQYFLPAISCN